MSATKEKPKSDRKVVTANRKARHEYSIEDTVEAGLVLTGTEIKSIRAGRVSLADSYARVENGEAWLYNLHISPYEQGNRFNVDSVRKRKLLLHRREIDRLIGKAQEKGMALIPLSLYLRHGFAKVELGTGRGKKLYDRRQAIADRDAEREKERVLRGRGE
jgi:SsrA-binding protein